MSNATGATRLYAEGVAAQPHLLQQFAFHCCATECCLLLLQVLPATFWAQAMASSHKQGLKGPGIAARIVCQDIHCRAEHAPIQLLEEIFSDAEQRLKAEETHGDVNCFGLSSGCKQIVRQQCTGNPIETALSESTQQCICFVGAWQLCRRPRFKLPHRLKSRHQGAGCLSLCLP